MLEKITDILPVKAIHLLIRHHTGSLMSYINLNLDQMLE